MKPNEFTVLIVEDDPLESRISMELLKDYREFSQIEHAKHGRAATDMLTNNSYDLVLMDIDLPYKSGLRVLDELANIPCTIFVTGHKTHALKAYDLGAIDYLVKPYKENRFHLAIERALKILASSHQVSTDHNAIIIKSRNGRYRINIDKINYITAHNQRSVVHTTDRDYEVALLLNSFLELLPAEQFIRIHRSYIVQVNCIAQIQSNRGNRYTIQLSDEDETVLPVGRSHAVEFRERLQL